MKILVIEICNFEDYPTGGQLSFVSNMMKAYGDELCLAGCSTDNTPRGRWVKKTVDGTQYDFFSALRMSKSSRKPLVPNRIKGFLALKRHLRGILKHEYDWIFIQAPEVLFALPDTVLGKVAIDLPGLNNPLTNSRYGLAKKFDRIYDRAFLKRLAKVKHVWATGCVSDIRDLAKRSGGLLREEDIIQLPTRYDGNIFYPADKAVCRSLTGTGDDCTLFVSVGRLNRHKGWPLMLQSLDSPCLAGRRPVLALIGDGEDEGEIRRFAEENGLSGKLILPGRLAAPDIALWLNAADVFVMGSEKEGWSTTLVEACACGVPCVVSDFSSAGDMICDGVNGFVVKERDPHIFAGKMLEALSLDRAAVREYDSRFESLAISRLKDEMDLVFRNSTGDVPGKKRCGLKKGLLAALLGPLLLCAQASASVIEIGSQTEFDRIQQSIEESVGRGEKDIRIHIGKGVYHFRDKHIAIFHRDWAGVDISVEGDGCVLIPSGHSYRDGDPFAGQFSPHITYQDPEGRFLDIFGQTQTAKALVKVLDKESGECLLRTESALNLAPDQCGDVFIRLTQWYWAKTYRVTRIEDGNIYFIADGLEKIQPAGYNVNYDFVYGLKYPRYRLCNCPGTGPVCVSSGRVRLAPEILEVHACESSSFLELAFSTLGSITLSGLSFKGNGGSEDAHLIWSYHTACRRLSVESCSFENISSTVLGAEYTDRVTVKDNSFRGCLSYGVALSATCTDCTVSGNSFIDCGKTLGPWSCITVCGDRYQIDHNDLCNFGYLGIFVGVSSCGSSDKEPGGIVEHNRLWQDEEFLDNHWKYTLMDSGAIYVSTCNDEAIVRNNVIRDIAGMKDNRGIFLDDGARNVKVYGNLITGIRNSYSIDSRRVAQMETPQRKTNVNVNIYDNLTDSPIRFEGNESELSCEMGKMSLIPDKDGKYPKIQTRNVKVKSAPAKYKSVRQTKWKGTSL